MSVVINLMNLKGGVGKTVSTINIAYALAMENKKIIIINADSQGNISTSMDLNLDEIKLTLAGILSETSLTGKRPFNSEKKVYKGL